MMPGTSFLFDAKSTPGHNAAGRITLSEKLNDLIENPTRDLPACIIVLQPTMLPVLQETMLTSAYVFQNR
jgi:hypothetical protein